MMRANRLLHALTIDKETGHFWRVYSRVSSEPQGCPFNVLLTYYYIKQNYKTLDQQIIAMQRYREKLVGKDGLIYVDSGVFSMQAGLGIGFYDHATTCMIKGDKDIYIDYVRGYALFLKETSELWDIAIDFDSDCFLSTEDTDMLHDMLRRICELPDSCLMRVYHPERVDSSKWWKELCHSPQFTHVAIGSSDPKSFDQHRTLTDLAKRCGKSVHALGVSHKRFFQNVNVDTADSTSHLCGGKFGRVYTPLGQISFARSHGNHIGYEHLQEREKSYLTEYWRQFNLTPKDLIESPYLRNLVNIWYMNEFWDVPYVEKEKTMSLFDILGV